MRARFPRVLLVLALAGCGGWGNGQNWVQQPTNPAEESTLSGSSGAYNEPPPPAQRRMSTRTLGDRSSQGRMSAGDVQGRVLGSFRNTYYDFPNEADFASSGGGEVSLMNASCTQIGRVPKAFHDSVCVQGSGRLKK